MAIKTIENVYISDSGSTNVVVCPQCNKATEIRVISSADYGAVTLLLGKQIETDFGVCPHCSSVFSIKPEYLAAKSEGTTVTMTPDDLTLMVAGK
ncbi:MAG: hypothetical protein R3Y27_03685 [Clostridia bacterium]